MPFPHTRDKLFWQQLFWQLKWSYWCYNAVWIPFLSSNMELISLSSSDLFISSGAWFENMLDPDTIVFMDCSYCNGLHVTLPFTRLTGIVAECSWEFFCNNWGTPPPSVCLLFCSKEPQPNKLFLWVLIVQVNHGVSSLSFPTSICLYYRKDRKQENKAALLCSEGDLSVEFNF